MITQLRFHNKIHILPFFMAPPNLPCDKILEKRFCSRTAATRDLSSDSRQLVLFFPPPAEITAPK